jgi:acyl-[acyl-carrier-protein]-phospholipid O-acyltransferase/long-chain-fatty-acid--[acyl-carrier-protein] ligase
MSSALKQQGFVPLLSTQFLGALNDNLLKMVVSLLAAGSVVKSGNSGYLSLTGVVFILPYILFSGYAGFVADKFDKRSVLIVGKLLEIVVMVLALWVFVSGYDSLLILVLFLAATQATFFSPAKYGILPEILVRADLSQANGYLEMSRYTAVIVGTALGGVMLATWQDRPGLIGAFLIFIACIGAAVSLRIARASRSNCDKAFRTNPWSEVAGGIRRLVADGALWPAVAGLTYFETLGALVMLSILLAGKEFMRIDDTHISLLAALAGVGVGIGALLAGRLSRGRVELGLVPLGALGMGVSLICLSVSTGSYTRMAALLVLLGAAGGLFFVPLNALLQQNAGLKEKGHLISTNNFLNMAGVLSASGALWVLHDLFGMTPCAIVFAGGLLTLAATTLLLWLRSELALAMFALRPKVCNEKRGCRRRPK